MEQPIKGSLGTAGALQLTESMKGLDKESRNPRLSTPDLLVNLHIDLEPQKDYRPGYPIEKRGVYYLARSLSAQLDLLTDRTDYGQLEKCVSIWICRDRVPLGEQMSISFYGIRNTRNIGTCHPSRDNYDLMELIVIRLGDSSYCREGQDVLEFLSAIFYPHGPEFRERISKYIDLDSCLEKEAAEGMFSLNEWFYQDGLEAGIKQGIGQGIEQGIGQGIKQGIGQGIEQGIEAFILEKMEDHVPEDLILSKLQRFFKLSKDTAAAYLEKYALAEVR